MSILHTLQDIKMNVINCNESILSLTARKQFLSNYIGTNFVFVFFALYRHQQECATAIQRTYRGYAGRKLYRKIVKVGIIIISLLTLLAPGFFHLKYHRRVN